MGLVKRPQRIKAGKNSFVTIGKKGISRTTKSGSLTITSGPNGTRVTRKIGKGLSWVTQSKKPR